MKDVKFTPEEDDVIRRMWLSISPKTGLMHSMAEIARVLDMTRNRVAGRIHRLGLTRKPKAGNPNINKIRESKRNKFAIDTPPEAGKGKKFEKLNGACMYELSGSRQSLNKYCGKACSHRKPFCDYHYDLCFIPMPAKIYAPTGEREGRKVIEAKRWME